MIELRIVRYGCQAELVEAQLATFRRPVPIYRKAQCDTGQFLFVFVQKHKLMIEHI